MSRNGHAAPAPAGGWLDPGQQRTWLAYIRRLFFGGLPEGLAGPLSQALESVYANIIDQGTLPPPVDWHPAQD